MSTWLTSSKIQKHLIIKNIHSFPLKKKIEELHDVKFSKLKDSGKKTRTKVWASKWILYINCLVSSAYNMLTIIRNTWNHINLCKLLVLHMNTWDHITLCKLLVLDKNTWNHIKLCKCASIISNHIIAWTKMTSVLNNPLKVDILLNQPTSINSMAIN